MRKLLLTTVSVVALGVGGAVAFAADGRDAGAAGGSNMPSAAGTTQPGSASGTGTTMGGIYGTGTSQPSYHQGMGANTGMSNMAGNSHWSGGTSGHNEVMEVQQKLQAANLYNGQIDGRMGPETRQALRQYQQKNGLRVTARLDQQTRDSILGTGATGQGSSMPPPTSNMPQTNPAPSK